MNQKLFPYLQGFKLKASGPNTIEYKIGEIFGEIKNKIHSGYNLREIIDHIDELRFRSQKEKHELSELYEAKIQRMGNAGRNGGEYRTPTTRAIWIRPRSICPSRTPTATRPWSIAAHGRSWTRSRNWTPRARRCWGGFGG